ncbi:MAG: FAD-dependent oxidoreductase, partial [Phycisphaerae bacterium]|jgi:hypothetical protein
LPSIAKRLHVPASAIRAYSIVRRSLDARRKDDIHFSYQVELVLDEPQKTQRSRVRRLGAKDVAWSEPESARVPPFGSAELPGRPTIIGFGPAGMLAALRLAQYGYRPLVLERGREVRKRHRDIMQRFYRERDFDPTSNLLFGEGGAGTYSDGKLYTRINDPLCRYVLEAFYHHGATPDVLIDARPHIGSDRLPTLCTRIRRKIEVLGGEVRFECQLNDIRTVNGALDAIQLAGRGVKPGGEWFPAGPTILAVGHSARDTVRMLHSRGVRVEPKPFQIGVRIEHPQEMVDRWQYGAAAGHGRLASAEYHAVAKGAAKERGDVFSFCMCPGGMILPANESANRIATNGASRSSRGSAFANSGLVLTIDPAELGMGPLESLAFQEHWERLAFEATGGGYRVPAQRPEDFLEGRQSDGQLETSYPLGGQWVQIASLVPESVTAALHRALPMLEYKFPGFAGPDGLITAPETRASGPVRLLRDPTTRAAVGIENLFPVGEGAGYAGGIVSAAVDGIKSADRIIRTYAQPR